MFSIEVFATRVHVRNENEPPDNFHRQPIPVEIDETAPPLPPKQRDVAINHRTEYVDDENQQMEIVRRKLEQIKQVYNERIRFLEQTIDQQQEEIECLTQPKPQRHVNTQCQPLMLDRSFVTDTFQSGEFISQLVSSLSFKSISVRDVALTCQLQPTQREPLVVRDVNLQCNSEEILMKRDVCLETLPEKPIQRDVSISVALDVSPDRHLRNVGTHVNFDYRPEIKQRDVGTMFTPPTILTKDRASNTQFIQTRDFAATVNTM